jgi:hypothetical protein
MLSPDRHRQTFGALLASELRIVGLAIAREAGLAVAAIAAICLLLAITAIRNGERIEAIPEILLAGIPIALILPWLVWRGDPPFGRAWLWTMPVRRQAAALAKVIAGAAWLMLLLLFGLMAILATAAASGGSIGMSEERMVGALATGLSGASPTLWSTPGWNWLVPFGAALAFYIASSAALLGLRHPVRWLAACSVASVLLGVLAENLGRHNRLEQGLDDFVKLVISGRYGLDYLLTGGAASLSREIDRPGPGSDILWLALPEPGQWLMALLVWSGAALIALLLALRRHWER